MELLWGQTYLARLKIYLSFFEAYLNVDIFTSKQVIFEFGKNFEKAAADPPA